MGQRMPESGWTVKIGAEARTSKYRGMDGSWHGCLFAVKGGD